MLVSYQGLEMLLRKNPNVYHQKWRYLANQASPIFSSAVIVSLDIIYHKGFSDVPPEAHSKRLRIKALVFRLADQSSFQ